MTKQRGDDHPKWFAVVTKFRNEKSVAKRLIEQGISAYVPLQKTVKQYTSRKKVHQIPLISCYVFVKIKLKEYVKVLETPNVIHFIKFSNKMAEIPENEIEILKQITQGEYPLELVPHQFREGDLVEIISGTLKGIKGKLTKVNNKRKIVVEFENISRSVSIEIDSSLLRRTS